MSKLRNDIHGVFAHQQSGLGSTAGVSDLLIRQALAPSPIHRRFAPQVAAALATLLVGAAAAYVVVVTHGHLKSQNPVTRATPTAPPSAAATPIPSPTALAQPLAVPDSTPVIMFFDPANPNQADAVTWDGSQRGRIGGFGGQTFGIYPNPAGTLYSTFHDIRDRTGQVVSSIAGNGKQFGAWADDGRHYCQMVSASALPPAGGEPATLRIVTVGGATRTVARVGTMLQQSGAGVAACSIERDRAVVIQGTGLGTGLHVWVVQLSSGRILWNSAGNFVASRDGQWLASGDPAGGSWAMYNAGGGVAGQISGPVQSFSWDGSLVVVGQYGAQASIVDWRTGKVVWTAPAGTIYAGALPEPGGSRIAVEVQTPGHPQTTGFPTVDVYAVSPDGTAVQILSKVSL